MSAGAPPHWAVECVDSLLETGPYPGVIVPNLAGPRQMVSAYVGAQKFGSAGPALSGWGRGWPRSVKVGFKNVGF